jgi:hypothetical protein
VFFDDAEERVERLVREVGRDLHQDRHRGGVHVDQPREELPEPLFFLQGPQIARVGRRHVHDDEVRDRAHRLEACRVIGEDRVEVVGGHDARLADRDAERNPEPTLRATSRRETRRHARRALVGEP